MLRAIVPLLSLALRLPAQTGITVEGTVTNRVTSAGIPGVAVTLFTRQAVRYQTTSDDTGAFRVPGMSPGAYQALFEKDGFVALGSNPSATFNIAAGQTPARVRLEMTKQIALRGRVLAPDGKPADNFEVKLGNYPARLSGQGEFTVENVEPGSYMLLASPLGARPVAGQQERTEVVPTYFPSVIDVGSAQHIQVRGDADLDGFEIRLQSVPVYRVSGIVFDQTGNPVTGAKLRLVPVVQQPIQLAAEAMNEESFLTFTGPGPAFGPDQGSAVSGADGTFEFPSVRSGDWEILADTAGAIDSVNLAATVRTGATSANIGRSDLDRLEIRLAPPPRPAGTIDWGDVTPPRGIAGRGLDQIDGGFSLRRVSQGRFYIVPRFGPGYYPVSVTLDGSEVLGQPVTLVAGSPPVHISYRAARASVHGTVENGAGASVILLPQRIQTLAFGRVVRCKLDGTFEISGVAPGDYFAAAVDRLDPRAGPLVDQAFFDRVTSIGTSVHVDQSAGSPIELKPIRWPE